MRPAVPREVIGRKCHLRIKYVIGALALATYQYYTLFAQLLSSTGGLSATSNVIFCLWERDSDIQRIAASHFHNCNSLILVGAGRELDECRYCGCGVVNHHRLVWIEDNRSPDVRIFLRLLLSLMFVLSGQDITVHNINSALQSKI